jgi:hypothetical protein
MVSVPVVFTAGIAKLFAFASLYKASNSFPNKTPELKSFTEYQIFDRVIEVLRAIDFKVFLSSPVLYLKKQENAVLYSLLLELMEEDAEEGKKKLVMKTLVDRYHSDDYSSDVDEKDSESEDESDSDEEKEDDEEKEELEEEDIDFIQDFRKRVEDAYKEEKLRRSEEDDSIEIQIL